MSLIKLDQVDAAPWGDFELRQFNLELAVGEVLGIIGPNGAGKSSLLQIMSGDTAPSAGHCEFLGTRLAAWESIPRARSLAVLPQLSLLNFPYSVEEVILLGRTPHRSGYAKDRAILQEVMAATDTAALRDRIYTQLSGGEKQRVQLARVFAQVWQGDDGPRLLLLDEPTTALDIAHQQLIVETIRRLAAAGCGVVIVSHDFNLIAAVADHVIAIADGKPVAHGVPDAVYTQGLFDDYFGARVTITAHPDTGHPLVIPL